MDEESLGTLSFGVSKSGVLIPFDSKMEQSFVSVKHLCEACLIPVSKEGAYYGSLLLPWNEK